MQYFWDIFSMCDTHFCVAMAKKVIYRNYHLPTKCDAAFSQDIETWWEGKVSSAAKIVFNVGNCVHFTDYILRIIHQQNFPILAYLFEKMGG